MYFERCLACAVCDEMSGVQHTKLATTMRASFLCCVLTLSIDFKVINALWLPHTHTQIYIECTRTSREATTYLTQNKCLPSNLLLGPAYERYRCVLWRSVLAVCNLLNKRFFACCRSQVEAEEWATFVAIFVCHSKRRWLSCVRRTYVGYTIDWDAMDGGRWTWHLYNLYYRIHHFRVGMLRYRSMMSMVRNLIQWWSREFNFNFDLTMGEFINSWCYQQVEYSQIEFHTTMTTDMPITLNPLMNSMKILAAKHRLRNDKTENQKVSITFHLSCIKWIRLKGNRIEFCDCDTAPRLESIQFKRPIASIWYCLAVAFIVA